MTKGLVLFSIVVPPAINAPAEPTLEKIYTKDSRFQRIKAFFKRRSCPMERYAADLVTAADLHKLDWRLLPSLALVESSGGKTYANNNVFGWDSCKQKFPTIQAGIHAVAERLANSPYYKGKTLDGKLKAYNQNPHYAAVVKRVMSQLATESW
ncbi:MAG: glucosaminidase domain-containing protein [Acidobacteria bacterium]|nr:glucosaminidase domain-containing protein [Acidobacteriota bacterium]